MTRIVVSKLTTVDLHVSIEFNPGAYTDTDDVVRAVTEALQAGLPGPPEGAWLTGVRWERFQHRHVEQPYSEGTSVVDGSYTTEVERRHPDQWIEPGEGL